MSTTLWVGDKMYVVDEPVRDYVDKLQAQLAAANEQNEKLRVDKTRLRGTLKLLRKQFATSAFMECSDAEYCQELIEQALKEFKA